MFEVHRDSPRFTEKVRRGVPAAVRGRVWMAMAAARAPPGFRVDGLYATLCASRAEEDGRCFEQIAKDVPRTLGGHIYFRRGRGDGQAHTRPPTRAGPCTFSAAPAPVV